jgi:hypothetical protein
VNEPASSDDGDNWLMTCAWQKILYGRRHLQFVHAGVHGSQCPRPRPLRGSPELVLPTPGLRGPLCIFYAVCDICASTLGWGRLNHSSGGCCGLAHPRHRTGGAGSICPWAKSLSGVQHAPAACCASCGSEANRHGPSDAARTAVLPSSRHWHHLPFAAPAACTSGCWAASGHVPGAVRSGATPGGSRSSR